MSLATTPLPPADVPEVVTVKQNQQESKAIALDSAKDDGEFAIYLDAGRFAQVWRVASMFSQSQMVPDHFKSKPADAFIVIQMAMRLQLDPFMLLQKTYVIGGKPAFEAQIAIALINSSGLFASSIRYDLTGEGDDRGCVAWVKGKDGVRLEGPRVSMATAKAEGWVNRNGSKWKTIPDLMMQYRAAAWFGRLHCPERLMGMLTLDEAQDITDPPKPEEAAGAKLAAATERRIDVSDAQAPPSPPAPDAPTVPPTNGKPPESASDRMAARVGASGK